MHSLASFVVMGPVILLGGVRALTRYNTITDSMERLGIGLSDVVSRYGELQTDLSYVAGYELFNSGLRQATD